MILLNSSSVKRLDASFTLKISISNAWDLVFTVQRKLLLETELLAQNYVRDYGGLIVDFRIKRN